MLAGADFNTMAVHTSARAYRKHSVEGIGATLLAENENNVNVNKVEEWKSECEQNKQVHSG